MGFTKWKKQLGLCTWGLCKNELMVMEANFCQGHTRKVFSGIDYDDYPTFTEEELADLKDGIEASKMFPASSHLKKLEGNELEFVEKCVLRCDMNVPSTKEKYLLRRWSKNRDDKCVYHKQNNKFGLQIRLWLHDNTDLDRLVSLLPNLSNMPTVDAKGVITISDNAFAWELIDKGLVTPTNKNKEEDV